MTLVLGILSTPSTLLAQDSSPGLDSFPDIVAVAAHDDSGAWHTLTPSQQRALRPLQGQWPQLDDTRRAKWLEVANRFPKLSPAERTRVQARMTEWAALSSTERGKARMNFREAQDTPASERKAKWEEYKALTPEQRKQLAAKAERPAHAPARDAKSGAANTAKSNVVPNSSYAPKPKPVSASVAQAQPGATTNLITKRPSPPVHQPAGLPKIAVTPGFVDPATLQPRRGPQGAATRSAAVAPETPPSHP